jgi:MraZ protein
VDARFYGQFEHSLDGKGRVILPAKFRGPFERGGYLTAYKDGCLALWTPAQFDVQSQEWLEREKGGREDRLLARMWAASSTELEVDRQGRIVIPQSLREWGQLEGEVLVNGAINRVELWNRAAWSEKVEPQGQRLTEGDDS